MKNILILASIGLLLSCSFKSETIYPFELVNSKTERQGQNINLMDLYVVKGEKLKIDSLRLLCIEKKKMWNNGSFYFLVVFDNKENATFPNNPFSALYGIEEIPQRHIKAIYTFNRLNGYSRLKVYHKNLIEGASTNFEI